MFIYFLVPVLQVGYLRYYTALSKFVQFIEDRVQLLECSPASCLAPRNHCEEKREKFVTHRINNKSPSHFGFDTCRHSVEFWKACKSIFFSFGSMKNIFGLGKTFLFERNTIVGHLLSCERVSRNQQNNAVNCSFHHLLRLDTWLPLSLKLTFSSQNHQKFSRQMACLGSRPSGKEGKKVSCPKGKSTCLIWEFFWALNIDL